MKIRSTAAGAAAAAAALAATLAPHRNATASVHPAAPATSSTPNDAGYRAIAATINPNEL